MVILPAAYMPSVEYVARLLREQCVIDLGENYIKRSERNRARILSANGVMPLTVHVENGNRPRQRMRDVRIDYSKRWQHQHWVSILSAYKSSPYFDHYAEELEPFYRREWRYLVDYNMEYLQTLLRLLGAKCEVQVSEQYVEAAEGDLDLRPKHNEGSTFVAEPYVQVFSDRMPFVENLSVLDLLLCEGPEAISAVLMRCQL
ncbi:MAG: WbqC family protein [Alistipes sp.]|nr:WbqC family protein [Alistipes sp.]MBP3474306.1 WbqC family protein [Alistipes sp.]MBQ4539665.1 WbqC family protein [Alistipes sp.]